ncbi:transglutaminase domain protein [Gluconacetobacter diazotrophicus PA1 5]|uniref:transglutaminase-like domain-containing protein n=1 Tax=Gluconacetobacter diazotrophicus TaxID=33996 RepID=UPI000173AEB9|nr:transglutaminase-like domain-containing protein [Gluconacetobacter diazotrophicus]ACI50534.1 transglutaminase domain protein [Gluconacetobacter diazotrophicus PA1 5]TWB09366.1 transglutaminase superfamily protein [Gluconacetobacter diazotrophicus]
MTELLQFADRYRTIDESRILKALLLLGWAFTDDTAHALAMTRQALDRWIGSGLQFHRDRLGQRLFDPVEVVHFLKSRGRQGQDDFWSSCYVPTSRLLVGELGGRDSPHMDITIGRTFARGAFAPDRTLRLRMPLPLRSRCDYLDVRPWPCDGGTISISDGRMDVRIRPDGQGDITIGADVFLAPLPDGGPEDDADREIFLRPSEGLIRITDPVAALARRLAGTAPTERAVRAFWSFIMDELINSPVHYDQIRADAPLDWVLEAGCYDCQLGAALLIGLCRARGIPARLVGGHFLYRHSPTLHYWAEIWTEDAGWRPFDFMSWDLSHGGQDSAWRDHFYGRTDARMITQCLPRRCVGPVGVAIPATWRVLQTARGKGVDIDMVGLDGASIYTDRVTVI